MTQSQLASGNLKRLVYSRIIIFIPAMIAILFLPAGTLAYWEAWVLMGILLIPMFFVMRYLMANSPELLERRMNFKEERRPQRLIVSLSSPIILLAFILPGFDHRFGWSNVPLWLVIMADLCVLAGYLLIILVFKTNRYASRVVEVTEQQQVISNGPYALVRHPMYVGVILLYSAAPLALGSYWALLPGLLIIPAIIARTINEEQTLHKELKGYTEYTRRVRYRLIPGLW